MPGRFYPPSPSFSNISFHNRFVDELYLLIKIFHFPDTDFKVQVIPPTLSHNDLRPEIFTPSGFGLPPFLISSPNLATDFKLTFYSPWMSP